MYYRVGEYGIEGDFRDLESDIFRDLADYEGGAGMTKEQYVNAVVKKVKCSGRKRKEIGRQLLSDVSVAVENGETLDEVMERMGTVREAAEEFNQNLSEAERKAYARSKRRTIVCAVLAALLLLVCGVYWILPKSAQIDSSGVFEEQIVEERVRQIITELDQNDFAALRQEAVDSMQKVITQETFESARQLVGDDWGELKSFGKNYMVEVKQMGKRMVTSQMTVAYEKLIATYTITLDRDLKLAGLYMK